MKLTSAISVVGAGLVGSKQKFPYPLVLVEWKDAQTSHGWEEETELESTLPNIITVGFLLLETSDAFLICSTVGMDKTSNSRLLIPKGMVTSSKLL